MFMGNMKTYNIWFAIIYLGTVRATTFDVDKECCSCVDFGIMQTLLQCENCTFTEIKIPQPPSYDKTGACKDPSKATKIEIENSQIKSFNKLFYGFGDLTTRDFYDYYGNARDVANAKLGGYQFDLILNGLFPKVKELSITRSLLKNITSDYFPPTVVNVNLSRNQITFVDEKAFQNASNIISLDLSYNLIKKPSVGVFKNLRNAETINLSGNQLSNIPDGLFDGLSKLKCLHLNFNLLTMMPRINGNRLFNLNLFNNSISVIEQRDLAEVSYIRELNLGNNSLQRIDRNSFKDLQYLLVLNLSNNKLKVAYMNWFYHTIANNKDGYFVHRPIQLEGNLLDCCDCSLFELQNHVRNNTAKGNRPEITCKNSDEKFVNFNMAHCSNEIPFSGNECKAAHIPDPEFPIVKMVIILSGAAIIVLLLVLGCKLLCRKTTKTKCQEDESVWSNSDSFSETDDDSDYPPPIPQRDCPIQIGPPIAPRPKPKPPVTPTPVPSIQPPSMPSYPPPSPPFQPMKTDPNAMCSQCCCIACGRPLTVDNRSCTPPPSILHVVHDDHFKFYSTENLSSNSLIATIPKELMEEYSCSDCLSSGEFCSETFSTQAFKEELNLSQSREEGVYMPMKPLPLHQQRMTSIEQSPLLSKDNPNNNNSIEVVRNKDGVTHVYQRIKPIYVAPNNANERRYYNIPS